tara:strand:+ start:529 stop:645 length:117 start_codon:yes stop_codon:yes gene_type:complete
MKNKKDDIDILCKISNFIQSYKNYLKNKSNKDKDKKDE